MGIPIVNSEQVIVFILVFLRIGSMLLMIPVIGDKSVPMRVKGGLTILISLLVFPAVLVKIPEFQTDMALYSLIIIMIGEVLIGIVLGLAAKIIFAGIQFAGEMSGFQIGFSFVNVIDPISSTQVSIISEFQYLLALLVFLAIDAHLSFIFSIVESYRIVSPFGNHFSGSLMQHILVLSKELFIIAIKISAPVMAVLLFTNVALGVVARTVPQINVFIVGFPLQIAAGLIVLGLTAPFFIMLVQKVLTGLNIEVYTLLRLMQMQR